MGIFEALFKAPTYILFASICGIWLSLLGMNQDNPVILALLSLPFLLGFAFICAVKVISGESKALVRWIGSIFS